MNRVAFILDQFELQSPGQQLLDRFLIGYKQNGEFHAAPAKVVLATPKADENPLIRARIKEFGLEVVNPPEDSFRSVEMLFLVPGTKNFQEPDSENLRKTMAALMPKQKVFIDGSFVPSLQKIDGLHATIFVSRPSAHLFPLPREPFSRPVTPHSALIVVQGVFPEAELDALFALKPYFTNSWTRAAAPTIQHLREDKLWNLAYSSDWRPLLEAAISRSDNIKGDPEKDGRTQDIVGLQLIEKLAAKARGWLVQHADGVEIFILVCDGALTDFNIAIKANNSIHSAQLYHAQSPMENHYDEMAAWVVDQCENPNAKSNLPGAVFISEIVKKMKPFVPNA